MLARFPLDLIERLDALAVRMAKEPGLADAAGPKGVTRSAALRLACREGLAVLEKRYGIARKK